MLAQSNVASRGVASHLATSVPEFRAAPLNQAIQLDGTLGDAAWASATPMTLDLQRDPDEGRPATERTEIRAVVGDGALYIGARMFDDDPAHIVSRLSRRDDQPASDRLTIRLDSRHDKLTAFVFDVYPAGNKGDASAGADGNEDDSWDPVWDVVTSRDSLGWTAEIRIPLSQLRYDRSSDTWGIQVTRFIQRKQESDVLVLIPKSENNTPARYATLHGMSGLPAARRMEITPYVTARAQYATANAGDPFHSGSDYFGAAGADLKLGVTSDLTLDATINPDFGQVELDPAVVNLSAFETSFDEKRPFFVEGSDLFDFGRLSTYNSFGTPTTFFSRRIGRAPQGQITDPDARFSDVPEQTTIAAAGKLTGKTSSGWSIALLDAVTPRETGRYVTSEAGPVLRQQVEPATNYFAGRIRRELREGNTSIGLLATAVNRSLGDSALASTLRSSAYLGGVDLKHYWDNRRWALDASYASSRIQGSESAIARAQRSSARYYQRPDAENLNYDTTATSLSGYAMQLAVTKVSGGHWGGNIAYQEKSPGYETNDLGFTQTVGRRGISTDTHYEQTRPGKLFRYWIVGILSGNDWNYDGDHTTSYVGNIINVTLRNFWSVNYNVFHYFGSMDDQFTRGGPLARQPTNTNWNLSVFSDGRGALTYGLRSSVFHDAAGSWSVNAGPSIEVVPSSSVHVSFEPSFTRSHTVNQFVRPVTDPTATATFGTRTVFAQLEQRELALDTRVDWLFSPTLSLQLYVQPLISAGDYSRLKEFTTPGEYEFAEYGADQGTISQDKASGTYTVDPDGTGPASTFQVQNPDFNFRSLRANLVLRWEFRPGSTLFLVWQQARQGIDPVGDFRFGRDFGAIWDAPATNVLAVKATWWMGF
ncbi:MAG TPA: DUF5916 domain-containing protein [Gemmatimonadales bacterium]|nr:DUF5916 domain-containing protein [Gemmatimonadales bacterium]